MSTNRVALWFEILKFAGEFGSCAQMAMLRVGVAHDSELVLEVPIERAPCLALALASAPVLALAIVVVASEFEFEFELAFAAEVFEIAMTMKLDREVFERQNRR